MAEDATVPIGTSDAPESSGNGGTSLKEITGVMAGNQREKIAATDKVFGEMEAVQKRLLPKIEELSSKAGVEAEKLKPWDADAEAAKRRTDPMEAFGSFGSVFGILASAFTHAPMENALNASAAAMNSIKQGDKDAYERAFKAHESNTKLALDRHKIMHTAYQDAVSLLNVNMQAANTKLSVIASRFGDKQVLALLDAGMNKEVEDLLAARQRNALALQEQMPRIQMANAEMSRLFALGYDPKDATSEQSQEALKKFKEEKAHEKAAERAYTPEQQAYAEFIRSRPDATPEERAEYIKNLKTRDKPLTPEQQAVNAYIEQNPEATAEQIRDFVTELRSKSRGGGAGGNTNLTGDRQRAADVAAYREELKNAKNEDGSPKYTASEIADKAAAREKELKVKASAPSGNKIDELTGKINRVEYAEGTIDKVEDLLKKHKAITGLGGTITRPAEVVGNIFGSNETDRKQFERYIAELQEWAPRILLDSNGRPLSAEAGKVATIIAGLKPGDTTANTARAYAELRPLLKRIKEDLMKRRSGGTASAPASSPAPKPSDAPWLRDPVVQ